MRTYRHLLRSLVTMLAATGLLHAKSLPEERYGAALAFIDSVSEQVRVERALCEEELRQGVANGVWSEDERLTGFAWLEESMQEFTDGKEVPSGSRRRSFAGPWADFVDRLNQLRGPITSKNEACVWFSDRVRALDDLRNQAAQQLFDAALEYCEDLWLSAKTPSDLAPAVSVLTEFKRLQPGRWWRVELLRQPQTQGGAARFRAPNEPLTEEQIMTVFDFWTVFASADPLILPDPINDFLKFQQTTRTWWSLRSIRHGFVMRPRITRRFEELNARYGLEWKRLQNELNQLILSEADPVNLETVLARYGSTQPRPGLPSTPSGPMQFGGIPAKIRDYKDLLNDPRRASSPANRFSSANPADFEAFQSWLAFKKAETSGDDETIRLAAQQLWFKSGSFRISVNLYVNRRVAPLVSSKSKALTNRAKGENKALPSSKEPLADLIAELKVTEGMTDLANLWSDLTTAFTDEEGIPQAATDNRWYPLASNPENQDLFSLRDQAVSSLLTSITGNNPNDLQPNTPLPTELREALDRSCRVGDSTTIRKLLTLNAAAGILPSEIHYAYARILRSIIQLGSHASDMEPTNARMAYRELISQADSPGAAQFAIDEHKKHTPKLQPPK